MKLRAHREPLLEAFAAAASVVPVRSVKTVLQRVRLQALDGEVLAIATDSEVAVRARIPFDQLEGEADILVPAAKLLGILRESFASEVTLETDDTTLVIKCGRGTFQVQVERPDEFPAVRPFPRDESFTLPSPVFRTLIQKTAFAAARERTRFAFNGVRFDVTDGVARMVATDGKRLAVKSYRLESAPDQEARVIPSKGLSTFTRLLRDTDPTVAIHLGPKDAMIRTEHLEVSSRLVEGTFPDYRGVLPAKTPYTAEFEAGPLRNALKQAAILTNEESRSVRFAFEEDRVVLTSRAVDVGESRIELEVRFTGKPLVASYNPEFFLEGLKAIDAERITLRLSGSDTPSLVEGEEDYIYLIMPVTIRTG